MADRFFLTAGGARIECAWAGRDRGRRGAIVLLHEGLGCVALWRDFPDRLAAATGRAVFVYSRQGYGGSDPCDLPRPLDYMTDEALRVLPDLLRQAGIAAPVLLGHSDGASIAAIHAGGIEDNDVVGVILMAPHFFTEDMGVASIAQARQAFDSTDLRERLRRYHGDNVDCAFNGWCDAWLDPGFRRWDIRHFLSGISVPVLIVQGVDDQYGTIAQTVPPQELCQGPVQVEMLENCRHAPQVEQPEQTLSVVLSFLADDPAP